MLKLILKSEYSLKPGNAEIKRLISGIPAGTYIPIRLITFILIKIELFKPPNFFLILKI